MPTGQWEFRQVKIPREFWKVIAFEENGVLKARGFLLSQNLHQLEALELDQFRVSQVPLTEIEQRARLRFPQALRDADLQLAPEEVAAPLISTADIRWGGRWSSIRDRYIARVCGGAVKPSANSTKFCTTVSLSRRTVRLSRMPGTNSDECTSV